jgi:hypothetical protein
MGARLSFPAPVVVRDEIWSATGISGEFTTSRSVSPGHRVRVRFPSNLRRLQPQSP